MKKIILILILLILNAGCIPKKKQTLMNVEKMEEIVTVQEEQLSPFSDSMEKIIEEFEDYISYLDSFSKEEILFIIEFYQIKDECFFYIAEFPFFYKNRILGYTVINGRTIVINRIDEGCIGNLIDLERLTLFKGVVPNFHEYGEVNPVNYDSIGMRVKVISHNNVEIIFKGMV